MTADGPTDSDREAPHDAADDLLARAAAEIRAQPGLAALVPLTAAEREAAADAAIAQVLGDELAPRRRRTGWLVGAGAAVALAAGVMLYLHRPEEVQLPRYAMIVAGEQATRGAAPSAGPVRLRPSTQLAITLTPEAAERDALVRLVLVRGGEAALLDPAITRRAGRLELGGNTGELLGAQSDGAGELVVVLGRALPGDDAIRALALGGAAGALRVLRQPVILEGFSHTSIDALLGGCRAVAVPARCEVAAGDTLELWLSAPADVALAGAPLAGVERAGGWRYHVAAAPGELTVRRGARELARWQLAAVAIAPAVRASDEARAAGRLADAEAALDGAAADAPNDQLELVRRRAKLARLHGEVDRERGWRDRAVQLARSLGRVSVEADETVAIVYGLMDQHELAAASRQLPALDALGNTYAEGAIRRDWVRGMLANELGDLGTALGAFRRALTLADRIGDDADRALVLGPLADVLESLGRGGETRALIDAEIARGAAAGDVCARVDALTNAGWLLRDADAAEAQRLVDQAAGLAVERCAHRLPIALVNQGWLLAASGHYAAARGALDQLAALHARDGRVTTWMLRLEAEVLLGEDPAAAAQHARHLAARAAALCSSELAYEASLLRARAEVRLGRDAAIAFGDAERALALWSRLVPLGEGRATFFDRHDQLALTALPYFAARGDRHALAETVRRSLARFTASLAAGARAPDDRDRRGLAASLERWPDGDAAPGVCAARDAAAHDEAALPAPRNAVYVHPDGEGWLVVAWRGSDIAVRSVAHTAEPAARIAEAAAALLAGAPRVQLHVHRSLAALPIDRRLAARLAVPVAYAVDAPARAARACSGPRRALIVADPQRNLWAAGETVPVVRADLTRLGFVVDVLEGAAATRAAVTERLADPCTAVFQYDGHAAAHAGDRVDDALLLSGGVLTAADILALPRAPAAVVLNGCTTAAPEGLGLAQAFVLAGADQVIASLDDVPAAAAARFTRALFAQPGEVDLVQRFARVMAEEDLAALRVFQR